MPQNQLVSKKVDSKVDIKCDLFLLKTVEIKGDTISDLWYNIQSSHWKNTLYISTHDCEEESCWREKEKQTVETLEILLGLINYGCIKYYFFKKKLNSN